MAAGAVAVGARLGAAGAVAVDAGVWGAAQATSAIKMSVKIKILFIFPSFCAIFAQCSRGPICFCATAQYIGCDLGLRRACLDEAAPKIQPASPRRSGHDR